MKKILAKYKEAIVLTALGVTIICAIILTTYSVKLYEVTTGSANLSTMIVISCGLFFIAFTRITIEKLDELVCKINKGQYLQLSNMPTAGEYTYIVGDEYKIKKILISRIEVYITADKTRVKVYEISNPQAPKNEHVQTLIYDDVLDDNKFFLSEQEAKARRTTLLLEKMEA